MFIENNPDINDHGPGGVECLFSLSFFQIWGFFAGERRYGFLPPAGMTDGYPPLVPAHPPENNIIPNHVFRGRNLCIL